jgi:hypothetical protein
MLQSSTPSVNRLSIHLEPRRLKKLRAFTDCDKDSFTFFFVFNCMKLIINGIKYRLCNTRYNLTESLVV